jgi:hypothetical protein
MCGGGAGSANDKSNDDEKDSGNSFKETLANIFTPGDGMSYVDGRLTENNKNRDQKFYDTTIDRDGEKTQIRRDVNDKYKQRYASALFGAATGGLPGLIGSIATNELTKGKTGAGIVGIGEAAGDALGGISQIFATPKFENQEEEEEYRAKQKMNMERHNAMMASMQGGNDGGNNSGGVSVTAAPTVALPGANMPFVGYERRRKPSVSADS